MRFDSPDDLYCYRIVDMDALPCAKVQENVGSGFDVWWTKEGNASLMVEASNRDGVVASEKFDFPVTAAITFLDAQVARRTHIAMYLPGTPEPDERQKLLSALESTLWSLDADDRFDITLAGEQKELLTLSRADGSEPSPLAPTAQNVSNARIWLTDKLPTHAVKKASLYNFFEHLCRVESRALDTMILVVGRDCTLPELGEHEPLGPNETRHGDWTPIEADFTAWWAKFGHARLQIVYLGRNEAVNKSLAAMADTCGEKLICHR